jgi:hypothetical protein
LSATGEEGCRAVGNWRTSSAAASGDFVLMVRPGKGRYSKAIE